MFNRPATHEIPDSPCLVIAAGDRAVVDFLAWCATDTGVLAIGAVRPLHLTTSNGDP